MRKGESNIRERNKHQRKIEYKQKKSGTHCPSTWRKGGKRVKKAPCKKKLAQKVKKRTKGETTIPPKTELDLNSKRNNTCARLKVQKAQAILGVSLHGYL